MYEPGAMTDGDWASVSNLFPLDQHNWGDRNKIDKRVIHSVDDLARELKTKILITCGTTGSHVQGSYHYPASGQLGVALDIMFPLLTKSQLPDVLLEIFRYGFTGIGMYSEWRIGSGVSRITQNGPTGVGGFHVDFRPVSRRALWLKGTSGYEALTMANLGKYFR